MMQGINVINTIEYCTYVHHFYEYIIFCLIFFTMIASFIWYLFMEGKNKILFFDIFLISFVSFFAFGYTVRHNVWSTPEYKVKYEVTISENVPYLAFNNNYNVLEQNGNIYTIEEKE